RSSTARPSCSSRPRKKRPSGSRWPAADVRIGFLGPEGTFTEQAAQRLDGERVPFTTVHDVVEAVDSGTVERGVVPIENSLEGAVNATLDALAMDFPGVAIVGESVLAVHQALIAREPLELEAITAVASHPQ